MIQHVTLEVRPDDMGAEIAFWALIGFAEVDPPPELRERFRWVQSGTTSIHLAFIEQPIVPVAGHTALVCEQYTQTIARLHAAGYDAPPRTEYWDAPRTIVTSPAGHRVELMAFTPLG
jgi:hypothetical protein